jgi:hypothetical protein
MRGRENLNAWKPSRVEESISTASFKAASLNWEVGANDLRWYYYILVMFTDHQFCITFGKKEKNKVLHQAEANTSSFVTDTGIALNFAIRAKELAQAELALARARIEAQQAKEKERANTRTLDVSADVSTEVDVAPTAPPEGSGATKTSPQLVIKPKKKMQKKQIPVGHRPVTRQARAKGSRVLMRCLFWNIRGFGCRGR